MITVHPSIRPTTTPLAFAPEAKKAIERFCPNRNEQEAFDFITTTYQRANTLAPTKRIDYVEAALIQEFIKNNRMRPLAKVAFVVACIFTLGFALIYLLVRAKTKRDSLARAKAEFRQAATSIERTCLALKLQDISSIAPKKPASEKRPSALAAKGRCPTSRRIGLSLWRKKQTLVQMTNLRTPRTSTVLQWNDLLARVNRLDPQTQLVTQTLQRLPQEVKTSLLQAERICDAAEDLGYITFTHGQNLGFSTINLLQAIHNPRDLIGLTRRRMRLPTQTLPYKTAGDFRRDFNARVALNRSFEDNQLAANVLSADSYHFNTDSYESALHFTLNANISQSPDLFSQLAQKLMNSLLPFTPSLGSETAQLLKSCEREISTIIQTYQNYKALTVIGVAQEDLQDEKKCYVELAHRRGRECDCTHHSAKKGHARTLEIITQMRAHVFHRCKHYSPQNPSVFNPQVRILAHNLDQAKRRLVSTVEIMPDNTRQQYKQLVAKLRFKLRTIKLVGELGQQCSDEKILQTLARMQAHSQDSMMQAFFLEHISCMKMKSKPSYDHIHRVLNRKLGELKGEIAALPINEHSKLERLEGNIQEILLSPFFVASSGF